MSKRFFRSDTAAVVEIHSGSNASSSAFTVARVKRDTDGSTSQAAGIAFAAKNDAGAEKDFAYIAGRTATVTAGAEEGTLDMRVIAGGTAASLRARLSSTLFDLANSAMALALNTVTVITAARHFVFRQYANTSLPSAVSGETIAISNTGIAGSILRSNGTDWLSDGVYRAQISSNSQLAIPAGWAIEQIYVAETAGNTVTGGIKIGTSSGGTDVVSAFAVAANSLAHIPGADILKRVFSRSASQNISIHAVTAWNSAALEIAVVCRKVY